MPAAREGAARSPGPGPPAPSTCWACWSAGSAAPGRDRPSGGAGDPPGHFPTATPVQGMARTTYRVTHCSPRAACSGGAGFTLSHSPPTQTYKDPALMGAN